MSTVYHLSASALSPTEGGASLLKNFETYGAYMRKEHFMCPSSKPCSLGEACRDIHIDPVHEKRVTSNPVHRHPPNDGECPRHPVGMTVDIFDHKSRQSTTMDSGTVLITAGSEEYFAKIKSGEVPPRMQQCTHFQRKYCLRGPECRFLHVVKYAPMEAGAKRAPMHQQNKWRATTSAAATMGFHTQALPVFSPQISPSHTPFPHDLALSNEFAYLNQSRSGSGASNGTSQGSSMLPSPNNATMQFMPQQQQMVYFMPQTSYSMMQQPTMMTSPQMAPVMNYQQQMGQQQQQQPMFVYMVQPPQQPQTQPFGKGISIPQLPHMEGFAQNVW